jgi:pimeloyl-ACP methyl ester carboxylesterase
LIRLGGVAASFAPGDSTPAPLIACVHGGGYNRHYFDIPDHSLLARASAAGFPTLSLDRPGYGDSDLLSVASDWFPAQAVALDLALGEAWERYGNGRPGIVLIGHSFGATVALRVAARQPSWPLLGLAINGTLDETVPSMAGLAASLADAPPLAPIALEPPMIRDLFYGPDGTFDPAFPAAADKSVEPAPAIEIREWATGWPRDVAAVTAAVTVPVQIRVAAGDVVQGVSPASLARFAARFTAAPQVDAAITPDTGHNTDHHLAGAALHDEQLAFARQVSHR